MLSLPHISATMTATVPILHSGWFDLISAEFELYLYGNKWKSKLGNAITPFSFVASKNTHATHFGTHLLRFSYEIIIIIVIAIIIISEHQLNLRLSILLHARLNALQWRPVSIFVVSFFCGIFHRCQFFSIIIFLFTHAKKAQTKYYSASYADSHTHSVYFPFSFDDYSNVLISFSSSFSSSASSSPSMLLCRCLITINIIFFSRFRISSFVHLFHFLKTDSTNKLWKSIAST